MSSTSTSSDDWDAPPSPHAASSFFSLPYELRARIVDLACYSNSSAAFIDKETASSLMHTASDTYHLTAPRLYRSVSITTPSSLANFARTLKANPALGAMIKSLHLGPDTQPRKDYWPLSRHGPVVHDYIKTSLQDQDRLPLWYKAEQEIPLISPDLAADKRSKAVLIAIKAAQAALGVDLIRPRCAPNGHQIGASRWFMGVLEIQAALDLYLMEVRRIEDEVRDADQDCEDEDAVADLRARLADIVYPTLVVTLHSRHNTVDDEDHPTLTLHREALLEHMARPGASLDHFEHPLLYIRSGILPLAVNDGGKGGVNDAFIGTMEGLNSDWDIDHLAQVMSLCKPESGDAAADKASSSALNARTTTGGILSLTRTVLAHTPKVENLSLSSYLQLAVWSDSTPLPPVRSLCLGIFTHYRDSSLCPSLNLHDAQLANLERLHISGHVLADQKIDLIAGLPRLKRVVWDRRFGRAAPSAMLVKSLKSLQERLNDTPPSHTSRRVDIWLHPLSFEPLLTVFSDNATAAVKQHVDGEGKYLSLHCSPNRLYVRNAAICEAWYSHDRWDGADDKAGDSYRGEGEWWRVGVRGGVGKELELEVEEVGSEGEEE